jgi:site-specific DNA-cytosine methylase
VLEGEVNITSLEDFKTNETNVPESFETAETKVPQNRVRTIGVGDDTKVLNDSKTDETMVPTEEPIEWRIRTIGGNKNETTETMVPTGTLPPKAYETKVITEAELPPGLCGRPNKVKQLQKKDPERLQKLILKWAEL